VARTNVNGRSRQSSPGCDDGPPLIGAYPARPSGRTRIDRGNFVKKAGAGHPELIGKVEVVFSHSPDKSRRPAPGMLDH
jgi:hypothetical protein